MADLTVEEQQAALTLKKITDNAITLSNIVELSSSVIIRIAGKDIADAVGNESLNRNVLNGMIANRIKEKLLNEGVK